MKKHYKMSNDTYNNPNGQMSIEDMIKLKQNNKVDDFLKEFKISTYPCPNKKTIPKNVQCFHCILDCWKPALDLIKEYKNYYKVRDIKYSKEELDDKSN